MTARIAILDYGMGNLHSVSRAIAACGGDVVVTSDAPEVTAAAALVIPGVGHFGACMRALEGSGLVPVVRDFVASGRPVLGVCVGMQILFEAGEEDAAPGLGLLPGTVRRLPEGVKVPHMGWNTVEWLRSHPLVDGLPNRAYFYFVHSYAPDLAPGLTVGSSEHGRPFSAVVARDNVFATQFHPEKSGAAGLAVYANLVKAVA